MFNQFNVNKNINIKAELLKNRREVLADITEDVNKLSYKLNEFSTMDIVVKKYLLNRNVKRINPLYEQIKDNMQIVLTINNKKERYIVKDTTRKSSKNNGEKTFKAYSFEKTLENKLITFSSSGSSYSLVNEHGVEGVLDIVATNSGWKIGYIDEMAKKEYVNKPITKSLRVCEGIECLNIQPGQLLWEASVDIKTDIARIPLNITIEHLGVSRYDSNGSQLTKGEFVKTILDPVHTGVTDIKAYYHSEAGNRYGIKVVLTLKDGAKITQIKEFTNLRDLKMICDEVNIVNETGYLTKQFVTKYAWIENVDTNIYSFLKDMQDEFNVVFMFDTYNNLINCYSKDNLTDESPLLLSFDSNVVDIEVKPTENPISAVRAIGKEDVSIINVNKYGSDIIYNYNYFKNNGLLSDELNKSLEAYDKYLIEKQTEWNILSENRRLLYENKVKIDCEIKSLSERIITLTELLSAFISGNASTSEQERIKKEKVELEKLFNENVVLRNEVNENIENINISMGKVSSSIKRENCGIFTTEDLNELNDIDIIENYSNDVATTSDGLYNSAEWYLNERTKPTVEFSIKCMNLIKLIKNPLGWNNVLGLAKLVCLDEEISTEIGEDKLRLVGIDVNVETKSIENLSFTNKIFPIDLLRMAKKMQKKVVAAAMNNSAFKSTWKESTSVNTFVNNIMGNGVDLTSTQIKTNELYSIPPSTPTGYGRSLFAVENEEIYSNDNDVEQSSAGIFIKSKSDSNKQLYIGAGIFAISANGFETSEVAIDNDGITAKLLKGKIILGEKLYITSDDGSETFYVGNIDENEGFGLCIKDETTGQTRIFLGTELDENGVKKAKLRLTGKNGEVAITEDGLVNTYSLIYHDDLDDEHPLTFPYSISSGTFEIRECRLSIFLQKYRMTVRALSSGGSVSTTSDGGGIVDTTGDGGFVSTSTANGGLFSSTISSAESVEFPYKVATSSQIDNGNDEHVHTYDYGVAKHDHIVPINIPDHLHVFTIDNHKHSMNIPPHRHELDTTHGHELEAGIFEATLPSNCALYINDILVADGINENTSIDIKDHLKIGQDNTIKITSETLGRIQLSILNKSFVTN